MSSDEPLRLADRLGLSVSEAARVLGVSERHLRSVLTEIPHAYVGRRVVIPVDSLRDWLRKRAAQGAGEADRVVREVLAEIDS